MDVKVNKVMGATQYLSAWLAVNKIRLPKRLQI